jgi:hypothetical protein
MGLSMRRGTVIVSTSYDVGGLIAWDRGLRESCATR